MYRVIARFVDEEKFVRIGVCRRLHGFERIIKFFGFFSDSYLADCSYLSGVATFFFVCFAVYSSASPFLFILRRGGRPALILLFVLFCVFGL